ncbi:MAG: hypothetical protein IPM94_15615 [bacterium]|nr:hypothetical protein [bacterium]
MAGRNRQHIGRRLGTQSLFKEEKVRSLDAGALLRLPRGGDQGARAVSACRPGPAAGIALERERQ